MDDDNDGILDIHDEDDDGDGIKDVEVKTTFCCNVQCFNCTLRTQIGSAMTKYDVRCFKLFVLNIKILH